MFYIKIVIYIYICTNLGVMHIHYTCLDLQPSHGKTTLQDLCTGFVHSSRWLWLRYRKTARSAEAPWLATYLDPIASVAGISLKDIGKQILDANSNVRSLKKLKPLVDVDDAQHHASLLADKLMDRVKTSQDAQNIFVPNISIPLIPVNDTEFQHLVTSVLSDATSTGVSAIHAEPGTGKSVAVALAMLTWAKHNPKCITVLIRGNLQLLEDFFRVS